MIEFLVIFAPLLVLIEEGLKILGEGFLQLLELYEQFIEAITKVIFKNR